MSNLDVTFYHTNAGDCGAEVNDFSGKGMDSPPLLGLIDGVSGPNGVHASGSTSSFPRQGWKISNYTVDVVY